MNYAVHAEQYSASSGYDIFVTEPPSASPSTVTHVACWNEDDFSEYEALDERGWDGYDAEPITAETVIAARRFNDRWPRSVRSPDIAPGSDGTIGFEWRLGKDESRTTIQIEVGPGDIICGRRERSGRVEHFQPRPLNIGTYLLIKSFFPYANDTA
jgi:hypothetical protein